MNFNNNFKLLTLVAALQVSFISSSYAASFTVASGATETNKQTLSNLDLGTVEAGGTLTTSGSNDAVEVGNGVSTLVNDGIISQTGTGNAIDTASATPVFILENRGLIGAVGGSTIKLDVNGSYILNNSGHITQTGTSGFGIDVEDKAPHVIINNAVSGLIDTQGGGDSAVIRFDRKAGSFTLDNQGTIWQRNAGGGTSDTTSRAVIADKNYDTTGNTVINGSETNRLAVIRADSNDAIRLGTNVTLTNYGSIFSTGMVNTSSAGDSDQYLHGISTADFSASDGVAIQDERSNVAILNYGNITGPRHGIDGGAPVAVSSHLTDLANASLSGNHEQLMTAPLLSITATGPNGVVFDKHLDGVSTSDVTIANPVMINYAGSTITGKNGSGIGLDGYGVVINHGDISGNYAGEGNVYSHEVNSPTVTINGQTITTNTNSNGDGDGVDIDGVAYIYNAGSIRGTGAGGYDSGGRPNGADGIAAGGGVIINKKGAEIYGQSTGILLDDGANGTISNNPATARDTGSTTGATARIYNEGSIIGERKTAIGLVGDYADLLVNYATGVIEGGPDAMRVDELGSTTPAAAVQMGGGNDILINYGFITGHNGKAIDLGAGDDLLRLFGGKVNGTIDGGTGNNTLETAGTQFFARGDLQNIQNIHITGGNTTFGGNLDVEGNLSVNGTLKTSGEQADRIINVGGNYTQTANGVLEVGVAGKDRSDRINVLGIATLADGATIQPVSRGYIANGASYRIVSSLGLEANPENLAIWNSSSLMSYSLNRSGNDLVLNAIRPIAVTNALSGNQNTTLSALDQLALQGSQTAGPLLQAVSDLNTTEQLSDALRQLAPQTNGAAAKVTQLATNSVMSSFFDRMDAVRGNDLSTAPCGLTTGGNDSYRLWAMGLGAWGKQKEHDRQDGFKLNSGGLAAGLEFDQSANAILGVSLSANKAKAKGISSATGDEVKLDNYNLGTYYSYNTDAWTFDAALAVGYNDYKSERRVRFNGFDSTVNGDYSGWNVSGRFELGLPFQLAPGWNGRWLAGVRASRLRTDSYTEEGNSAIAQHIDKLTTTSVQSVLGAELNHQFEDQGSLRFRARYLHEFRDLPDVNARFVSGGNTFNLSGDDLSRNSFELGLAYRALVREGMSVMVGYDAELSKRTTVHKITARAVWEF